MPANRLLWLGLLPMAIMPPFAVAKVSRLQAPFFVALSHNASRPQPPLQTIFPCPYGAFLAGQNSLTWGSSTSVPALQVLGWICAVGWPSHERGQQGLASSSSKRSSIMANIGNFTRQDNGNFSGSIRTLAFKADNVTLTPNEPTSDHAPDLRIRANGAEIGAAWEQASKKTGSVYYRVKLDDPSFTAPIFANLVQVGDGWQLIWERN